MPLIADYSQDDEESKGDLAAGGGSRLAGASGAVQAQPSKQQAPEFTPWSRFVSANADVSKREADKLSSRVAGDISKAKNDQISATDKFNNDIASNYNPLNAQDVTWGRSSEPNKAATRESPAAGAAASSFGASKGGFAPQPAPAPQQQQRPAVSGPLAVSSPESKTFGINPKGGSLGGLTDAAKAGQVNAPKSLEDSMGAAAWGKLVGETQKAQQEAKQLGSESGVQALLQQQGNSPNSAFDAALINGAGGRGFRDTAKQGGDLMRSLGNAQTGSVGNWNRLMGDIDNARADAEQKRLFDEAAAGGMAQQQASAESAAKKKGVLDQFNQLRESEDFKNGYAAYSGGVDALYGSRDDFIKAYENGGGPARPAQADSPETKAAVGGLSNHLGIPEEQVVDMLKKMTDEQWKDFWVLGIIPEGTPGVDPNRTGIPGGWSSPLLEGALGYRGDGGLGEAFKQFAIDAGLIAVDALTGGPSGAVKGGVKAATYQGPGGSK